MTERNWLLRRAELTPGATALEFDHRRWTFAELADRARRAAAHALASAAVDEAPLALLLPGGNGFAVWFYAVALAGRTVLPLNPRLTTVELAQQLADARAAWLLGEAGDVRLEELARRVPGLRVGAAPDPASLPEPPARLPGDTMDDDAALAVLFTSGTTGRARGACLSWGAFRASAEGAAERLGEAVRGRWLACMPLFHVGGLSILLRSALYGGPVLLHARYDARAVSDALDRGDVAGVSLVPTMLSRLLDHRAGRAAPEGLAVLLLGGATIPPGLLQRALAAGYPVCTTYGLTEACSQVATSAPPARGAAVAEPMRPLRGVEVRIVAGGRDPPAGEPGEIIVRGGVVMRGYLNDPAATSAALRGGWLHTGDIGYLDATGSLHVLDRRDDLVISGGENVYPAEVEAVLLDHPAVADAAVAGLPDPDLGAGVVAWIVKASGAALDASTLESFCRARLAGYKVPRQFRFVTSLPRTATGKLQRLRLAGNGRSPGSNDR